MTQMIKPKYAYQLRNSGQAQALRGLERLAGAANGSRARPDTVW